MAGKSSKNLFISHHDQLIDSDIVADLLPSAPFFLQTRIKTEIHDEYILTK